MAPSKSDFCKVHMTFQVKAKIWMSSVIEEAVRFRDFAASYRIEKPVKREDFKWKN